MMRPATGFGIKTSFSALLFSALCLSCVAQAPPPPPDPSLAQPGTPSQTDVTTLKITTREVLLDVIAVDKFGQPVTRLKAADFKVTEEGQPQIVRRVDEHRPMPTPDLAKLTAPQGLPPNTFTNYTPLRNANASIVLLLDAMDSPIGAQMAMREQLVKYLKHMQPGPSVAIFQLDTEMRLIQGFTSDPKVLLAAAESKRDMPSLGRPTAAPRSYTADAQYRRALMQNLRSGMQMLGSYLSGYPGRKNLIWFTGRVPLTNTGMGFGYPFRDGLTVMDGVDGESEELTDVLTVSRVAVYPVDTLGLVAAVPEPMSGGPGARGMMNPRAQFNRGIPGFENHANMDQIAQETGGKAYYNTNDFTRVISDVINTGSSYYTVDYATTNTKWNGELRHIKITVDRPDVILQHKNGYYAYSLDKKEQSELTALEKRKEQAAVPKPAAEQQSAEADPETTPVDPGLGALIHHSASGGFGGAMALGAIPPTEIVFFARVDADTNQEKLGKGVPLPPENFLKPEWQHKPFRNYAISFSVDAHKIRLTRSQDGMRHGKVEFVAVVYAMDGEEVNSLINTASFDLSAAQYRKLIASGLPGKMEIAIPVKGNYFIRLGVHDVTGDQVGALEIPVDQIKVGPNAAR
jgi:VWFA-related protein